MQPRQISPRKGASVQRKRYGRSRPRVDQQAPHACAEVDEVQLHQQRCALKDLDIGDGAGPQRARCSDPHERDEHANDATADECYEGEHDGPARRQQQIPEFADGEVADHACLLQGANSQRSIHAKSA